MPKIKAIISKTWTSLRSLTSKTKAYLVLGFHKVIALFRYLRWSARMGVHNLKHDASNNTKIARKFTLVAISVALGYIFTSTYHVSLIEAESLSNYLVTAGTMIGGILAIVFSLTIFGQQNILDIHSTHILNKYVYGFKEKAIFMSISLIVLVFFAVGIGISGYTDLPVGIKMLIIYGSLISIALVFILIDIQYILVSGKASSANIFNFLIKRTSKTLARTKKDIRLIQASMLANSKVSGLEFTPQQAEAHARNRWLPQYEPKINEDIKVIYEITLRLLSKQEFAPANNGVDAIYRILCSYLFLIKDSSQALANADPSQGPLSIFTQQSDSASFLNQNLDRLARLGEQMTKGDNVQNVQFITSVFKDLANRAASIKHIGYHPDNQVLSLVLGYQSQHLDFAIREKHLETVFQYAQSLRDLMVTVVKHGSHISQKHIEGDIDKIIDFAIKNDQQVVVNDCFNAWIRQLLAGFLSDETANYNLSAIDQGVKNIMKTTRALFLARSSGLYSDSFGIIHGYNQILINLPEILNHYNKLTTDDEKDLYKRKILSLFDSLSDTIRELAQSMKSIHSPIIDVIGRLIEDINSYIIWLLTTRKEDFKDIKNQLEKLLSNLIHLPTWFASSATTYESDNSNRSLVESVAKTGIELLEKNFSKNLIEDCIEALSVFIKHLFKKNPKTYLFDEARVAMKICYLAILARKLKRKDVYEIAKTAIAEFQRQYQIEYQKQMAGIPPELKSRRIIGLPDEDRLLIEMYQFREKVSRHPYDSSGIMDDASDRILNLITIEDVDWFIFEVWHEFDARSPIADEIEKSFAVLKLAHTLKKIAETK